jgi:serine/threonine protein phosphatase PrpC
MNRFVVDPKVSHNRILSMAVFSWSGCSHFRDNHPGEDWVEFAMTETGAVVAVADGVGSAKAGGEGAKLFCKAVVDNFSQSDTPKEQFENARNAFLSKIQPEARSDHGTTGLVVSVDDNSFWAGIIGDGLIALVVQTALGWRLEEPWELPEKAPEEGIVPVTAEHALKPEWFKHSGPVYKPIPERAALLLLTDGFTRFIGDFDAFLDSMISQLSAAAANEETMKTFAKECCQFFENAGSDDDKTLAVVFIHPLSPS